MPRGGRRAGAGRKPKSALEQAIGPVSHHGGKLLQHPSSTAIAPIETFEPSAELPGAAKAIWKELAPHAFTARTLTRATAAAFEMLCRNVVLERALAGSALGAAGADHRGMIARVNAGLKDFGLSPFGKPIYKGEAEAGDKPLSPLQQLLARKRGS